MLEFSLNFLGNFFKCKILPLNVVSAVLIYEWATFRLKIEVGKDGCECTQVIIPTSFILSRRAFQRFWMKTKNYSATNKNQREISASKCFLRVIHFARRTFFSVFEVIRGWEIFYLLKDLSNHNLSKLCEIKSRWDSVTNIFRLINL